MNILERLAELEHKQWVTWAKKIIETEPGLSKERVERWQKLFVPYSELPDEFKEYDREWARYVLRECRLCLEDDAPAYYFGVE